jgi:hypothetical protein
MNADDSPGDQVDSVASQPAKSVKTAKQRPRIKRVTTKRLPVASSDRLPLCVADPIMTGLEEFA